MFSIDMGLVVRCEWIVVRTFSMKNQLVYPVANVFNVFSNIRVKKERRVFGSNVKFSNWIVFGSVEGTLHNNVCQDISTGSVHGIPFFK